MTEYLETLSLWVSRYPTYTIIAAFFIGFVYDFVCAKWTLMVAQRRAFAAANWSFLFYICGLFYITLIVDKVGFAILTYLLGSYFGTYYAVKWGKDASCKDSV